MNNMEGMKFGERKPRKRRGSKRKVLDERGRLRAQDDRAAGA